MNRIIEVYILRRSKYNNFFICELLTGLVFRLFDIVLHVQRINMVKRGLLVFEFKMNIVKIFKNICMFCQHNYFFIFYEYPSTK